MEIQQETLSEDELYAITGWKLPSKQREWLTLNKWKHSLNRANHPVVGRIYARMMLAGIDPASAAKNAPPRDEWLIDLSKVS